MPETREQHLSSIHVRKLSDFSTSQVNQLIRLAAHVKKHPDVYSKRLKGKTLLMLFEKPSLRTRLSFEVAMTQLGGHAINYNTSEGPLGKKENLHDTVKCICRYCDFIMARTKSRGTIDEIAKHSTCPLINGLDDEAHPAQLLSDLFTITEKMQDTLDLENTSWIRKNKEPVWSNLKVAFLGDCRNNVTYDLMRAASMMGFSLNISGPKDNPVETHIWDEVKEICSTHNVNYFEDPKEAVKGVHVIYTDSWMSYHISKDEMEIRKKKFQPYQVTTSLLELASSNVTFMNCLPAMRGMEQTAEVIDGDSSVVFDQAENRLHAQKAMLLYLDSLKRDYVIGQTRKRNRVVVAFGGNALTEKGEKQTYENIQKRCDETCKHLINIVHEKSLELCVTFGNGPQIGSLLSQNQIASEQVPGMPLSVLVGESQGMIGLAILQSLTNGFENGYEGEKSLAKRVTSILTRIEVDKDDEAFKKPSKPIGKYMSKEEAEKKDAPFVYDKAKDGYRIVVPSPKPKKILESDSIKKLIDEGFVVVAGGGGGVPVYKKGNKFNHIDAVIDKDKSSALLAKDIHANVLLIVTDIAQVTLNFKESKDKHKPVPRMTVTEARKCIEEGKHFDSGSMLPKIEAAISFVKEPEKICIITSIANIEKVMKNLDEDTEYGTRIIYG